MKKVLLWIMASIANRLSSMLNLTVKLISRLSGNELTIEQFIASRYPIDPALPVINTSFNAELTYEQPDIHFEPYPDHVKKFIYTCEVQNVNEFMQKLEQLFPANKEPTVFDSAFEEQKKAI